MQTRALLLLAAALSLTSAAYALDTDNDGFPDSIESAVGTDPANSASTPTGSSITPVKFFNEGYAQVMLDFTLPSADSVFVSGYINVPVGTVLTGKPVAIDVAGFVAATTMQADGSGDPAVTDVSLFLSPVDSVPGATHYFSFYVFNASAASFLEDEGITNKNAVSEVISGQVTVLVVDKLYSSSLMGIYNATLNTNGDVNFIPGFDGDIPEVLISEFFATPNPVVPNTETVFRAAFKVTDSQASVYGYLDFGDGTPQASFSAGPSLAERLKDGIPHTYTAIGVYQAELIIYISGFSSQSFKTFVLVGDDAVVNVLNGLISSAQLDAAGLMTLNINIQNVTDAINAQTLFEDFVSQGAFPPASRATQVDGLIPSRTVTVPGITVATTTAVDGGGQPKAKIRKMVPVGGRNVGDSGALPPPPSPAIVLKKVSGKFVFVDGKPDQVSFQGTITLPTGYNIAKDGGNTLVFGMGNIVDKIQIDAKGKPLNKSVSERNIIKKISVKYPKLAGGIAAGGEIATISVTFGMTGMSNAGFDTEGITPTLRSDEANRKSVPRFIQVNLLLSDVGYDALLPVSFKVSKKADAGTISGRGAK